MKQIIMRLGAIKYVLDSETDTITDITIVLNNIKKDVESPQSEMISLAEKTLDASFEQLANAFCDVRELIAELSEIEANKDLPPVKKKEK